MVHEFVDSLMELEKTIKKMAAGNKDSSTKAQISPNFKKGKELSYYYALKGHLKNLDKRTAEFLNSYLSKENSASLNKIILLVNEIKDSYLGKDYEKILKKINEIYDSLPILEESKTQNPAKFKKSKLPQEIREEVFADIQELEKCYAAECYRSCVVLCGRILETCLHRKYFDVTGFDVLEKSPGIGLGNLIAKMQEKEIKLAPGITQQIHLINNVRIHTVHKKKELFVPSKEQTNAIILFTIDSVNQLF